MKWLVYILLLALPVCGRGQVVAVQNDRDNVAYIGEANPITIAVENCPAGAVVVRTDNGRIEEDSTGKKGHYFFWPAEQGTATIYVEVKTVAGIKNVHSYLVRVKHFPSEIVRVAGKLGGSISKTLINTIASPTTGNACGIDLASRFKVTSFSVTVVRDSKKIFNRTISDVNGARIDSTTEAFFKRLQDDDKVLFEDIVIQRLSGNDIRKSEALSFTITNSGEYDRRDHGYEKAEDPVTGEKIIKKW